MDGVFQRGKRGTFYVRMRIPDAARYAFGTKTHIWRSLRTSDRLEAMRLAGGVKADLEAEFAAAIVGESPAPKSDAAVPAPITPESVRAAIAAWRHDTIQSAYVRVFNAGHIAGDFPPDHAAAADLMLAFEADNYIPNLARNDRPIEPIMGRDFDQTMIEALGRHGLKLQAGHPVLSRLRQDFADAWLNSLKWECAFWGGDFTGWPEDAAGAVPGPSGAPAVQTASQAVQKPSEGKSGLKLDDLLERYRQFTKDGDEKAKRLRVPIARLKEFLGDPDVADITTSQMDEWAILIHNWPLTKRNLDHLTIEQVFEEFGGEEADYDRLSPPTVWNNWLAATGRVFKFAVKRRLIPFSPIILGPKPSGEERAVFEAEDVAELFSRPLFTGSRDLLRNGERFGYALEPGDQVVKDAAYWLPMACLWSGCRMEEIAGAAASDVKCEDGIWFIDLRQRKLKNKQSQRQVPIHSRLIDLGFVKHAQSQPDGGMLFPELLHDGKGAASRDLGKWFGRWRHANAAADGQGIGDRLKPFHSTRHTWKRAAREAAIGEEISDLITGHIGAGGVGRGYGRGVGLKTLKDAIEKVQIAGFPERLP